MLITISHHHVVLNKITILCFDEIPS